MQHSAAQHHSLRVASAAADSSITLVQCHSATVPQVRAVVYSLSAALRAAPQQCKFCRAVQRTTSCGQREAYLGWHRCSAQSTQRLGACERKVTDSVQVSATMSENSLDALRNIG
jgi:hypothetical protein